MTAQTEPLIGPDKVMDVREIPCSIKHGLVLKTCCELPVGEFFILRNGHDPAPLREHLEAEFPAAFKWECVHQRPEDVGLKITKVKAFEVAPREFAHTCGH